MLRTIKICIFRRRLLLLSLAAISVVFVLMSRESGQNRRYVKPVREKVYYNLMEENKHMPHHLEKCTLEYANDHKLQQDHPCVLDLIRRLYLAQPAASNLPLNLKYPNIKDPSAGQVIAVQRILRNLTNGFFVESGAADGESFSNSLVLERDMNWTGLLIEPEPGSYSKLLQRNRKSWTVPVCLSLEKYPTEVSFTKDEIIGKIEGGKVSQKELESGRLVNVQCFPLYSILLAHGRTAVDFFSLDVEGHELEVLKTIPWRKVNITMLAVEWEHVAEGYHAVVDFMKQEGYVNFGNIATQYARDVVFVKDFLYDLRVDYDDYDE